MRDRGDSAWITATAISGMATETNQTSVLSDLLWMHTQSISDVAAISLEGGTATLAKQDKIISDLESITSDLTRVNVEDGLEHTYTVVDGDGDPVEGATVYAYSDSGGTEFITKAVTNALGVATFYFRVDSGTTIYFRAIKSGYDLQTSLDAEEVS